MNDLLGIDAVVDAISAILDSPLLTTHEETGALTLIDGDPEEVVIIIDYEQVTVGEFSLQWDGPHTPTIDPIIVGTIEWQGLATDSLLNTLQPLLAKARADRRARFRKCRHCGEQFGPEHMLNDSEDDEYDVCHGCAEQHLGVLF